MNYSKLSFSSLGCPDLPIEGIVRMGKTYGFSGVSLRTVSGTTDLQSLECFSSKEIENTADLFRNSDMCVVCMSSGVRFTSSEASELEKQRETARWYIDTAHMLGCESIRVFGGPLPEGVEQEQVIAKIVPEMKALSEYARDKGVMVLLETHDSFSTGKMVKHIVEMVDHPSFNVVWDILHSYRWGEEPGKTWDLLEPYVKNIHVKDSMKYDKESFDLVLCGEGSIPIPQILGMVVKSGYDGWVEFEWERGWHPEIPEASIAFPHFMQYLKSLGL